MNGYGESMVTVELADGSSVAIRAEQIGPALVSKDDIVAKLDTVTRSIEAVGRDVLEAAKRVSPGKATVELGFGLGVESGQLIALFARGKGEATIKVTLEWSRESPPSKPERPGRGPEPAPAQGERNDV
jgi:Trypsin-co-occurring domain 1